MKKRWLYEKKVFLSNTWHYYIGDIIGLKKVYDWKTYYPTEYLYGIITKNDLRTVKLKLSIGK